MISTEFSKMCFVIMPFGKRQIAERDYDFDAIFENVFKMAISMVTLPEGGSLVAKRADSSSASGIITDEMFRDILYARVVLADTTGLNPNVFYELGVRHALRPTSTVVIKETKSDIPFDVRHLRIFTYSVGSVTDFGGAVKTIKRCLEATLSAEGFDSPVVSSLRDDLDWPNYDSTFETKYKIESWSEKQKQQETIEEYINEAKRAIENQDIDAAIASCKGARALAPDSLHINMQLGILLKSTERFHEAEEIFRDITKSHPDYAGAWRELGVVEHKLKKATDAVNTLEQALKLNPDDSDAWGSLGGVQKTLEQYGKAQDAYERAIKVSPKSMYALLNFLTMQVVNSKQRPDVTGRNNQLTAAIDSCRGQIERNHNQPWSYFDLAQLHFFSEEMNRCEHNLRLGVEGATARWQVDAARKTYQLILGVNVLQEQAKRAITTIDETADNKEWD